MQKFALNDLNLTKNKLKGPADLCNVLRYSQSFENIRYCMLCVVKPLWNTIQENLYTRQRDCTNYPHVQLSTNCAVRLFTTRKNNFTIYQQPVLQLVDNCTSDIVIIYISLMEQTNKQTNKQTNIANDKMHKRKKLADA